VGLSRVGALRPQFVNKLRSLKIYFSRRKVLINWGRVTSVRGGLTRPPNENRETERDKKTREKDKWDEVLQ